MQGDGLFSRHRGIILMTIAGVIAGLFALTNLPITLYPETTKAKVGVSVPYPGFTPEDFREQYGEQIERRLQSLEDVESVEGQYWTRSSRFTVEFSWDVEAEDAERDVDTAMSSMRSMLPPGAEDYSVFTWGGGDSIILGVAAYSSELTSEELYNLIEPVLTPQLETLADAEFGIITPVTELRAEVEFDPDALLAQGLHISDVLRTVESGYQPIPLGSRWDGNQTQNVRVNRNIPSIFDVGRIPVAPGRGRALTLEDVADVSIGEELPRQLYQANGERAVMLIVGPRQGGNIKQMTADVRAIIDAAAFPDHVSFEFLVDPSAFIDNAIAGVIQSALLGALFALVAIVLFLGDARNVFVVFLSIPLATVLSFALMYLFDISINLISLGGMTLSVGMIIDATVVVMENIHRHRREQRPQTRSEYRRVINEAVREVRAAITGAVVTSVLVFLPLSFTSPLTNAILGNLARTVIFALVWSLVVALTVVPIAAYYLFRGGLTQEDRGARGWMLHLSEKLISAIRSAYLRLLTVLIAGPVRVWVFLALSMGTLVLLAYTLVPKIPQEIMGKPEADRVVLFFSNEETTDQEEILYASQPLSRRIRETYPEKVLSTFTQVFGQRQGNIIVTARSVAEAVEIQAFMEEEFQSDDVWQFEVFPWDPAELPLPQTFDLEVRFEGPDPVVASSLADEAADYLRSEELYLNVFSRAGGRTEELEFTPRTDVIDSFPGLTVDRLASDARFALSGGRSISMSHEGRDVDIRMRWEDGALQHAGGIPNLLIPWEGGAVPLRHFFDTRTEAGLSGLSTLDGQLQFVVLGFLPVGTSDTERKEIEAQAIDVLNQQMDLPDGYRFAVQDSREEISEAIDSLLIALLASVVLIFLALGFQFNSIRIPLVILVTIPLGFMGVIGSLFLFESTISLNSMLGTILLGGIVVNNAILLIDFYFQHRARFSTTKEAVLHAAHLRFAPILITMSTTVLGMVPIAFALTQGTGVLQPLGVAVAGGLLVSTLFTLFMIPAILTLMHPERVTQNA